MSGVKKVKFDASKANKSVENLKQLVADSVEGDGSCCSVAELTNLQFSIPDTREMDDFFEMGDSIAVTDIDSALIVYYCPQQKPYDNIRRELLKQGFQVFATFASKMGKYNIDGMAKINKVN